MFKAIARDLATLDFALYHRMLGEANVHDGEPLLSLIKQPILMITGERDIMTPPSVTETVRRRAPQTELLMVPRDLSMVSSKRTWSPGVTGLRNFALSRLMK